MKSQTKKAVLSAEAFAVRKRLALTEFLLPLLLGGGQTEEDEGSLLRHAVRFGLAEEGATSVYSVLVSAFSDQSGRSVTSESHASLVTMAFSDTRRVESFFVCGRIVTLVVLPDSDESTVLRPSLHTLEIAAHRRHLHCAVGISRPFTALSRCGNAYFEAITAHRYTADGTGNIRFIGDQERPDAASFEEVEKTVFTLEQLLKTGSDAELSLFLQQLREADGHLPDFAVIQILATVYRTVSAVSDREGLSRLLSENPLYARVTFHDDGYQLQEELSCLCRSAREVLRSCRRENAEVLCDAARQIIETDFGDPELSLSEVSRRLAVSSHYLSALIKRVTTRNFVTLLTEKRMTAAREQLMTSKDTIAAIAVRCGYRNAQYFSTCFKKWYGASPKRMRYAGDPEEKESKTAKG